MCRNERDDRTTPLCILPSAPASEASAQPQEQQETAADQSNDPRTLEERGFAVHEEVGFLAVPVDADAIGVYDWCQVSSLSLINESFEAIWKVFRIVRSFHWCLTALRS